MARPMPRTRRVEPEEPRLALPDLVRQLANDGAVWADAELALARVETAQLLRRIAAGIGMAVVALPVMVTGMVILAQTAVVALTPALRGPALAGLAVGFVLTLCSVVLALVAWHFLSVHRKQLLSPVLRWLTGAAARTGTTA